MSIERHQRLHYDATREARRRLLVGVSGLAVMLLLVMLVRVVTGPAREEADLARAQAQAAGVSNPTATGPDDGGALADLGVEPAMPGAEQPAVPSAQPAMPRAEADGLVVPDLQPDPQLDRAKSR